MEISSQSLNPTPPDKRIDFTKRNREAVKESVAEATAAHASSSTSADTNLAKRIKNAREQSQADADALAKRIANARENAIQDRIQNARTERQERVDNARDSEQADREKRIQNARSGSGDTVEISVHVAGAKSASNDGAYAAKVEELKVAHQNGSLNSHVRIAKAAERMLSGD